MIYCRTSNIVDAAMVALASEVRCIDEFILKTIPFSLHVNLLLTVGLEWDTKLYIACTSS
jgi:hypothetical protein